jgi:hypothetical protein
MLLYNSIGIDLIDQLSQQAFVEYVQGLSDDDEYKQ